MKIVKNLFVLFLCSCSSSKTIPLTDVVYTDGINKIEANSIAKDYIKKNIDKFCPSPYIYETTLNKSTWEIELGCDANSPPRRRAVQSYQFSPSSLGGDPPFREGGFIVVDNKTGTVKKARIERD